MPTVSLPRVPAPPHNPNIQQLHAYVSDLADIMARFFKESEWLQNGNMDSQNVAEISGYRVGPNDLKSKDGDVGLSSDDTGTDPVRLWAGDSNKDTAPWRVLKSGKMIATGALIQSSDGTYPLIIFDPDGDLFGAYGSATSSIVIKAFGLSSVPYQEFKDGASTATLDISGGVFSVNSNVEIKLTSQDDITLRPQDLYLNAINQTHIPHWGALYSMGQNETLDDALDDKVDQLTANASYGVNMAFDPGTRNLKLFAANGSTLATVNIP